MKRLNNYILEKLRINDKFKPGVSTPAKVYEVAVGDKVLIIDRSSKKDRRANFKINLSVSKISRIDDYSIWVENIDKEYKFENWQQSPRIPNTIAFWKKVADWSAIMKEDTAIKRLETYAANYDRYAKKGIRLSFSGFEIDKESFKSPSDLANKILDELKK